MPRAASPCAASSLPANACMHAGWACMRWIIFAGQCMYVCRVGMYALDHLCRPMHQVGMYARTRIYAHTHAGAHACRCRHARMHMHDVYVCTCRPTQRVHPHVPQPRRSCRYVCMHAFMHTPTYACTCVWLHTCLSRGSTPDGGELLICGEWSAVSDQR